jgi:hypothetical protein
MGFLGTAAISRELDEQWKVLTTLRLVLDPAKMAAADLKRRYADHAALGQAIIDFARPHVRPR